MGIATYQSRYNVYLIQRLLKNLEMDYSDFDYSDYDYSDYDFSDFDFSDDETDEIEQAQELVDFLERIETQMETDGNTFSAMKAKAAKAKKQAEELLEKKRQAAAAAMAAVVNKAKATAVGKAADAVVK